MRAILVIIVVTLLSGCSRTVDVPKNTYGLVFYTGYIKKVVKGPAKTNVYNILGNIKYINKNEKISFANGKYNIAYEVTDPKEYYIKTIGMGAIFIVRKVNKTVLNMSFNGVAIKGKYQIIELIENMKLPIKIKK